MTIQAQCMIVLLPVYASDVSQVRNNVQILDGGNHAE